MVLYLCDCRKPCAMGNGCHQSGSAFGFCKHTTDPSHALYGACAEPQNYPDRFEAVYDKKSGVVIDYFEKEQKHEDHQARQSEAPGKDMPI